MRCTNRRCYSDDLSIGITREVPEQNSRIRTYRCNKCGKIITTQEYLYVPAVRILERDGSKPYFRPEYLNSQLASLVNLYDPVDVDPAIYSVIQDACRKFYAQGKKEITRATLDKFILTALKEQYPLLCIAYYLKYVIIEKNKVPKYFRQLINQFTINYAKEKEHARKLVNRNYQNRLKRNKSNTGGECEIPTE